MLINSSNLFAMKISGLILAHIRSAFHNNRLFVVKLFTDFCQTVTCGNFQINVNYIQLPDINSAFCRKLWPFSRTFEILVSNSVGKNEKKEDVSFELAFFGCSLFGPSSFGIFGFLFYFSLKRVRRKKESKPWKNLKKRKHGRKSSQQTLAGKKGRLVGSVKNPPPFGL